MIGAPVLHANADDPEAVFHACCIATEWKHTFQKDVVIDIVGYRRHGHNERDNPESFLPLTYDRVKNHERVASLYAKKLISEGVVTLEEVKEIELMKRHSYEQEWKWFEEGKYNESAEEILSSNWQGEALQVKNVLFSKEAFCLGIVHGRSSIKILVSSGTDGFKN